MTENDFYKLEGVLVLAKDYTKSLDNLHRIAAEITGEKEEYPGSNYYGITSDAIFEGNNATELLARLQTYYEKGA